MSGIRWCAHAGGRLSSWILGSSSGIWGRPLALAWLHVGEKGFVIREIEFLVLVGVLKGSSVPVSSPYTVCNKPG